MLQAGIKTNGGGACPPNCLVSTVASLSLARDVIEETYGELPYLAYGNIWTTGVYVVNSADTRATYSIAFYNPDGSVASVPFGDRTVNSLTGTLPPHGSQYVEASNAAAASYSTVSGFISADSTITVQGLFRDSTAGVFYEAGVPSTSGGTSFTMPFDFTNFPPTGQPLVTGIAVSNMDPAAAATLNCGAFNQAGGLITIALIFNQSILPLGQYSGYQFAALAGQSGTINCTASTRIAAIGVRQAGLTFSTLPVIY